MLHANFFHLDNYPPRAAHHISGRMGLSIHFLHILLQVVRQIGEGHAVWDCKPQNAIPRELRMIQRLEDQLGGSKWVSFGSGRRMISRELCYRLILLYSMVSEAFLSINIPGLADLDQISIIQWTPSGPSQRLCFSEICSHRSP